MHERPLGVHLMANVRNSRGSQGSVIEQIHEYLIHEELIHTVKMCGS
jgi:hypothetical protein